MAIYERRLILFLDILGFKSLVEQSRSSSEKLDALIISINKLKEIGMESEVFPSQMLSQFSDNIVLSYRIDEPSITYWLIGQIQLILMELVGHNILARGALTVGELYHDENSVIGPGLVEAYELESKVAVYPRVIIDESVLDIVCENKKKEHSLKEEMKYINHHLRKDSDGWYWIDYISQKSYTECATYPELYNEYTKLIDDMISTNITSKNPSIRAKYKWLRAQLDNS